MAATVAAEIAADDFRKLRRVNGWDGLGFIAVLSG
jgi:hypothetical protein